MGFQRFMAFIVGGEAKLSISASLLISFLFIAITRFVNLPRTQKLRRRLRTNCIPRNRRETVGSSWANKCYNANSTEDQNGGILLKFVQRISTACYLEDTNI